MNTLNGRSSNMFDKHADNTIGLLLDYQSFDLLSAISSSLHSKAFFFYCVTLSKGERPLEKISNNSLRLNTTK